MAMNMDDPVQAAQFLYRATFGPKSGDIAALRSMGVDAWLDEQFQHEHQLHRPLAASFATASGDSLNENARLSAWWDSSINAGDQLRQRVVFALSQIFVVSRFGGPASEALAEYYDVLIKHAFGNFRDMLEAVTLSPAMGKYLTLEGSRKADPVKNTFPDENYAREVMQLFSLGLWKLKSNGMPKKDALDNNIPTYTQNDVEELARVLTGWRIDTYLKPMYADDRYHDVGEKRVLGQVFPAGQSAEQDLKQAIEVLFNHRNTPVYISTLLIKRLTISNPRRSYIKRVAQVFKDNGKGERGDMKAVVRSILLDPDLLAGKAMADYQNTGSNKRNFGKVKEPVIAMANLCRAFNVQSNDPDRWWDFASTQNNYGQGPLRAPSVFNFYESDYAPKGEINEKSLTAPEFNILSMDVMRRISNRMWTCILSHDSTSQKKWSWDRSDFERTVSQPEEYVALINERLFGGLMSVSLSQFLATMLSDMTLDKRSDDRKINDTLFAVQCSPEFRCQE
ncbi:DUF1800 domain-containing protein [Photobacterium sp. SDRW27]|uniref:DUF1800 domain-containing protein n=1 Tax=Photobacterium obscurum TaxID=2829490 RepID=UPI00224310A2|nr:DUF1800 domain-containing protein [Photobacterium obscurum]MCW8329810.1 DUF1800 domain-containing protein [Photobacterium obscurum]